MGRSYNFLLLVLVSYALWNLKSSWQGFGGVQSSASSSSLSYHDDGVATAVVVVKNNNSSNNRSTTNTTTTTNNNTSYYYEGIHLHNNTTNTNATTIKKKKTTTSETMTKTTTMTTLLRQQQERPPLSETVLQPQPFPRWGGVGVGRGEGDTEEEGIHFEAIQAYSKINSNTPDTGRNLLHRKGQKEFAIPNLFYIFGGTNKISTSSLSLLSNTNRTIVKVKNNTTTPQQQQQLPQVWVASRPRKAIHWDFVRKDRYAPMEVLLLDALEYLLRHPTITRTNETKWTRLKHVVQTTGIPMFIHLSDYRDCSKDNLFVKEETKNYTVPIFTLCAAYHIHNCNYSLPLPSYKTFDDVYGKSSPEIWDKYFQQQTKNYPWNHKNHTIVWRGSGTGEKIEDKLLRSSIPEEDWRWSIRRHMVYEATTKKRSSTTNFTTTTIPTTTNTSSASKRLDVGFTNIQARYKNGIRLPQRGYIPFEKFQNYLGILDVDGNAWSSRFASLLAMNSVVLKVEPEFTDYFLSGSNSPPSYSYFSSTSTSSGDSSSSSSSSFSSGAGLQPWVHYVPIRMDSSDLHDIVDYVLDPANDLEMRTIVENAHSWVRTNLLYEKILVDTLNTLEFYVNKLDKGDHNYYHHHHHDDGDKRRRDNWTIAFDKMKQDDVFQNSNQFQPLPIKESVQLYAKLHK